MIVHLCDKCHHRRGEMDYGWQTLIECTPIGLRTILVCPACTDKERIEKWDDFWNKMRADMGLARKGTT